MGTGDLSDVWNIVSVGEGQSGRHPVLFLRLTPYDAFR